MNTTQNYFIDEINVTLTDSKGVYGKLVVISRACLPGRLAGHSYRKRTFMVPFVSVMVIASIFMNLN